MMSGIRRFGIGYKYAKFLNKGVSALVFVKTGNLLPSSLSLEGREEREYYVCYMRTQFSVGFY